jgi:hypothetical protein
MLPLIKFIMICGLLYLLPDCAAQYRMQDIDMNQIPQRKIRTLISELKRESSDMMDIPAPTYRLGQDIHEYWQLESKYRIREKPINVWETYLHANPAVSWNGRMVSFGLLVSEYGKILMYRRDRNFARIDTGQILYINLRLLRGIYNLAVGLEIVNIDSVRKSITYSYLKGGKSRGQQTISFNTTKEGYTQIIHHTAYKGDSYLRDRLLYPYFHRIAINEFHRNMKRAIIKNETI